MLNKELFTCAHQVCDWRFYSTYQKLVVNQYKTYKELETEQETQLKHMMNFVYRNVPYYRKVFDNLKLHPSDIKKIEDLEKLPILNKSIIRENWNDFIPVNLKSMNFYDRATGGSTGSPFKYRLSKYDRFLSGVILYRGWGYAGYELGDKMVFLAGSSLGVGTTPKLVTKFHEIVRNIRKLSSFDMTYENLNKYAEIMNSFEPKILTGYASSIYFLANFLDENNISVTSPQGIITTAEKLFPNVKNKIETVFGCDVYDSYGLNDGGVTAFECSEHEYLHVDTERSIMEVVDENNSQIGEGKGTILATSLYNFAMPFIRYDTGDIGSIVDDVCSCGRNHKLLKEIIGRQQDILQTPEGKYIYGGFFTHIFWEINGIKEFQITQKKLDTLIINVVAEENFDENQLNLIREIIQTKSNAWNVEFKYVDKINQTAAGKYKYIINELK
ncbi:phenylacetate--CoA ligase family protein [Methanosarcina sp. DH2]|uniref:phenylacetate--CoA ligase family protein n=1 Tax=Methanosarcina sp. DH2 TaxID=2605639 RepID=UPI001E3811D0|nr:phenylacetate--CoA ligase family protein [Methanosarcina sp. DH2]MCC4768723.1 phenylacetate--CoA ligase family protein [Methanosarcina sp. DH2]